MTRGPSGPYRKSRPGKGNYWDPCPLSLSFWAPPGACAPLVEQGAGFS